MWFSVPLCPHTLTDPTLIPVWPCLVLTGLLGTHVEQHNAGDEVEGPPEGGVRGPHLRG